LFHGRSAGHEEESEDEHGRARKHGWNLANVIGKF
jgi:hypothetical protein